MFEGLRARGYEVVALHHAEAIITHDMPDAAVDLEAVLSSLTIPVTELVGGGGGETQGTQRMRRALAERGWHKRNVTVKKLVKWGDGDKEHEVASLSHEIDQTLQRARFLFLHQDLCRGDESKNGELHQNSRRRLVIRIASGPIFIFLIGNGQFRFDQWHA